MAERRCESCIGKILNTRSPRKIRRALRKIDEVFGIQAPHSLRVAQALKYAKMSRSERVPEILTDYGHEIPYKGRKF